MESVKINGKARIDLGKKGSKKLRKEGQVPCVIYGGSQTIHFSSAASSFKDLIFSPDFKLAEVTVDGNSYNCILKENQFHPVTDDLVHLDFLELVPNKKVKVEIPLRFEGTSPGVKNGGKLIQLVRRIKVKTIPEKIVDQLVLNISQLKLGSALRVRDIKVEDGIDILNSPGIPVASVEIPRALKSATDAEEKEVDADAPAVTVQ